MRVVKNRLVWGYHELAFSARTSGVECPFLDEQGRILGYVSTTKSQGSAEIPEGARYFLKRYFTNKGYPCHELYELPSLRLIATIRSVEDVEELDIPEKVKEFLTEDLCR